MAFPLALLLGGVAGYGYLANDSAPASAVAAASASADCDIKGNISIEQCNCNRAIRRRLPGQANGRQDKLVPLPGRRCGPR